MIARCFIPANATILTVLSVATCWTFLSAEDSSPAWSTRTRPINWIAVGTILTFTQQGASIAVSSGRAGKITTSSTESWQATTRTVYVATNCSISTVATSPAVQPKGPQSARHSAVIPFPSRIAVTFPSHVVAVTNLTGTDFRAFYPICIWRTVISARHTHVARLTCTVASNVVTPCPVLTCTHPAAC